jgi:hypothetical protein
MDFNKILRQGKRRFETKDVKPIWGRCDYCDERRQLFNYKDNKKELWMLCEECTDFFVKEEE